MQPTFLGGVNFVLHAAGWLEGGLTMGYEKFVLDNDQCGMWHEFAKGVDTTENGQALDALLTNGPGQHFLGHAHTLANFETAFYRSPVSDSSSFEQWEAEGATEAAQRASADLEEDARGVRAAADRRRRRRGAQGVDRAEEGVLPGLGLLMDARATQPSDRGLAEARPQRARGRCMCGAVQLRGARPAP